MYNRYLRNDQGTYTCIPQEEPRRTAPPPETGERGTASRTQRTAPHEPPNNAVPPSPPRSGEESRDSFAFLDRLLDRLHLQDLDGADLMLLALLFFLFEEKADDELLIALGLLLIL